MRRIGGALAGLIIATGLAVAPASAAESTEAAVVNGWGDPAFADDFNYTGAPNSTKWSAYSSAGHAGQGLRRPAQWVANGEYVRATGKSDGTTGGMSFKPDRGSVYGRWEVRMRVPARDKEYHPVLIVWPDAGRVAANNYQEIDFSESTSDPKVNRFFLHYSKTAQSSASKALDMSAWHNYAVEWQKDKVVGYIDGVEWFRETNATRIPRAASHLTVQLDWFPDGTATSTSYMDIDWVKVYKPTSATVPPTSTPTPTPPPPPSGC